MSIILFSMRYVECNLFLQPFFVAQINVFYYFFVKIIKNERVGYIYVGYILLRCIRCL